MRLKLEGTGTVKVSLFLFLKLHGGTLVPTSAHRVINRAEV